MKLIIDIPEEIYERFGYEYREENCISKYTNDIILNSFCNGTPLERYIEDIKAEIGNNVEWHFKNHQEDIAQIYSDALNIIDKHIADMGGPEFD